MTATIELTGELVRAGDSGGFGEGEARQLVVL
jgi:hypothetical protein